MQGKSNQLPFIKHNKNQQNYWHTKPTGDYQTDYKTGQKYAQLTVKLMTEEAFPPLLTWIIRDMPKKMTGLEMGFLTEIASQTIN